MYTIKHKHRGSETEYNIYVPADSEYCLESATLDLEMGKAGELSITLPATNPAMSTITCLTDEVIVYRDYVEIWRGRPITSQQSFNLSGTLTCEGILAYLYDTCYQPFEFQGKPGDLLKTVINNHNSFVSSEKKFTIGNVTVIDNNDYVNRSSTEYKKTIDILSDHFIGSSLGGYFRARVSAGVKYLDYLSSYNTTATQKIEFGSNILDLATEIQYGDAVTAILPLGAADEETGEKLTVASVNGGDIYVRDTSLIATRGFVAEVVEWEDVTVASNLLSKAQTYLSQASAFIQTFTIKAIDLHYADVNTVAFNIGDAVRVVSSKHSIDQYSELYKMSLDLLDPSNDSYEFGITRTSDSLTGRTASSQRNIQDSLSSLTVNFHKIAANYASIDYLSANYATIVQLDAANASITNLQAKDAEIESALINKADISALTAANANITNLQASYANIKTLLSGTAGVGDLQSIHLTSENAVIDVAVIKNLLANNITVNDLMAGDIITNKQRIISNDGSFVIDGSTQTIKDENGNVRIQIGRDANDEFTFVLYNAAGTGVLIDADGIKESAISDGLIKDAKIANDANIQATKLDIASLFSAMNADGSNTLYANKIWFSDTNQTLSQVYTQTTTTISGMQDDIEDIADDADAAYTMAQAAQTAADQATRALEGLTSLDNLTAILTNDAHVVHTDYDGNNGDYSYAKTQVMAFKGDTDVTARAEIHVAAVSGGIAGTWNTATRTYTVTEMTALNGYVDFSITYGTKTGYVLTPDGNRIITPDGKYVKTYVDTATVYKRFSVSKAPDGMAGTTWVIESSVGVLRRSQDGLELSPSTITFTARKTIGEVTSSYSGKYKIEETSDLTNWTQKYYSSTVEESKTYTPTVNAKMIRATLMDGDGTFLDSQTVTVIADADEMNAAIQQAQSSIQSVSNRVGVVETGINGLQVDLADTQSELHGVSDGNLLFQTPHETDGDTVTFSARVYKAGDEVHTDYPSIWFQWFKKTEDGVIKLGDGYNMTVSKASMGYGGSIIGRFSTFTAGYLTTPDGYHVLTPDGKNVLAYGEPDMVFDVETNLYQDEAIANKFSSLDTKFSVTEGKIAAIISDSDIAEYMDGSTTMNTKLSALVQTVDGISLQVSDLETDSESLTSRVTTIETTVDGISSSVVYTNNYTGEVIASLINQSASNISISAQAIDLSGYVTLTNLQTAGQTTINGSNISGGTLKLGGASNGNGQLLVYNANNGLVGWMDNEGLYAIAGTIGGFTINASSLYNGKNALKSLASGVYISTSGISVGSGSAYTALASGYLYGGATASTTHGYVGFNNYWEDTKVYGSRLAGRGCICLLTNGPFGIGSYYDFGTDATITVGQTKSVTYVSSVDTSPSVSVSLSVSKITFGKTLYIPTKMNSDGTVNTWSYAYFDAIVTGVSVASVNVGSISYSTKTINFTKGLMTTA